jgi:diguanylate cyclase (GGDEF)-like protein
MKKKRKAGASNSVKNRKPVALKTRARKAMALARSAASASSSAARPDDAKSEVRRLKAQLAKALARIDQVQAAADTDFLLEIPNRRGFERELRRAISYIQRYHAGGALIMLDVDRLKPVNDNFGHAAGDQVLKAVVAVLSRQIRSSDVIGRLGGDEFAILLWNLSETDAYAKAAALEADIDRLRFEFAGRTVAAGASAGVAILGPHSHVARALAEADRAMYLRKVQRRHENNLAGANRT